jgi:phosphoribosylanthranilate isomerase
MTLVKICGITNFPDAQVAVEAGADFLGFIFYEKSPRQAAPEVAARIIQAFDPDDHVVGIGVYVSPPCDQVRMTLAECDLKAAQIHKLGRDELRDVQHAVYGAAYAAVQPRTLDEALTALDLVNFDSGADYAPFWRGPVWCPQLLIDAYHPDLHGGTGQRADFEIAREMLKRMPRLMLAGGLTPDNVGEAIRAVRPWAVDVASGTEIAGSPGKKDHGKVRAFIQAVREVDKELGYDSHDRQDDNS